VGKNPFLALFLPRRFFLCRRNTATDSKGEDERTESETANVLLDSHRPDLQLSCFRITGRQDFNTAQRNQSAVR